MITKVVSKDYQVFAQKVDRLSVSWAFWILWVLLLYPSLIHGEVVQRITIIVTGLGGSPAYRENFIKWATQFKESFQREKNVVVYIDGSSQSRKNILQRTEKEVSQLSPGGELWFILVGHANYDGENYKFNIKGPDLTDEDLAQLLDKLDVARTIFIAGTSSAGALIPRLRGSNRVIVAATTVREKQPPMFLSFFSESVSSFEADRDKNNRISLLEAFLYSRQKVSSWFEESGRLQTEHAILDDSARFQLSGSQNDSVERDRRGFGLLSSISYLGQVNGVSITEDCQQSEVRSRIQRQIDDLKLRKKKLREEYYYRRLEELLVELAASEESAESSKDEEAQQ